MLLGKGIMLNMYFHSCAYQQMALQGWLWHLGTTLKLVGAAVTDSTSHFAGPAPPHHTLTHRAQRK